METPPDADTNERLDRIEQAIERHLNIKVK